MRKYQCSDDSCGLSDVKACVKCSRSLMHDNLSRTVNESDDTQYKSVAGLFHYSYIQIKRCCPRRGKFGLEGEQRQ